jgi:putative PIN family toxin of toxin-antitoxin system
VQKVVLDTNVLVSGIIASGYSAVIVDAVRRSEIQMVTSVHVLEEFGEVILRRHIVRKYPGVAEEAETLLDFLRAFAVFVPGIPEAQGVSIDRDDDFILACALEEQVDCIVSGDPHLLDLKTYRDIPILTPKEFVETMLKSSGG